MKLLHSKVLSIFFFAIYNVKLVCLLDSGRMVEVICTLLYFLKNVACGICSNEIFSTNYH